MGTLEQDTGIDPDPDPTPIRGGKRRGYVRDPSVDDWQKAQDQYERWLDRLGGDTA